MSTSYYLIDKASLQRKNKHDAEVDEVMMWLPALLTRIMTVADEEDYTRDIISEITNFECKLKWLIEAHEQDICNTGYKRCSWHMSRDELQEQYKTGYYVIQDEYGREYTLEEFMRKVE